jgi:superfamily II DNA or RNA helicase
MMPLRDYQERAVSEAVQALEEYGSALFVCPTGGGKTFVFAELATQFRQRGRILVLADREHLVEQAATVIAERTSLEVGIEQGSRRVNRRRMPDVVCATIQSMRQQSRLSKFKAKDFALVVIDEADLGVAPSYGVVLERFPKAKVFGCTATPDRADGKTLGSVFKKAITPLHLGNLITQGFLSSMRRTLIRIESVTLDDLSISDGDYAATDLEHILTHEKALHEVVRPSIELAGDRPSIVFCATVKHAEALADVFNRYAPMSAAVIHGGITIAERRKILCAYEQRKIRFLCSCALLLRGVDLPLTSCVIMARPTQSRALYCQAIGRGTRIAPDKSDLLVLDFTDNSQTHSLISPVDILTELPPEVRERAREIADSQPDCDPQNCIKQAENELAADPELRASILARVSYRTESVTIDWDSQPFGKISDLQLAKHLGVSTNAVGYQRRQRGIPKFSAQWPKYSIDWHAVPFDLMTNSDIVKMFGVDPARIYKGRKLVCKEIRPHTNANYVLRHYSPLNYDKAHLGEMDDRLLAYLLRVRVEEIIHQRKARGIPEYQLDFDKLPLGKAPDGVIALNHRLHKMTVAEARIERGITPHYATKITLEASAA